MMKRVLVILLLAGLLAGCETTGTGPLIQDKYTVVTPPDELYTCPQITKLPDPTTLTDLAVAKLIVRLDENNKTCGASMKALKKFYQTAQRRFTH